MANLIALPAVSLGGIDRLRFLEDVGAASESLERLADLLRLGRDLLLGLDLLDRLRFLEDVGASSESLERLGDLLGLDCLGHLEDVGAVSESLERGRAERASGGVVDARERTVACLADHTF